MRRTVIALVMGLLTLGAVATAQQNSTFTGQISDSICSRAGSHTDTMEMSKDMGKTAASCTVACVDRLNAKFVLWNQKTKKIYDLSDQAQARKFAGKNVRVTGSLDKSKINVKSISAL